MDFQQWKERFLSNIPDWKKNMERIGVGSAYAFIAATALWPVVETSLQSPTGLDVPIILNTLLSGVGRSLLANQIAAIKNATFPEKNRDDIAKKINNLINTDQNLREALDIIMEKLDAQTIARQSLISEEDKQWFTKTFIDELKTLNSTLTAPEVEVNIQGGINITNSSVSVNVGPTQNIRTTGPLFTPIRELRSTLNTYLTYLLNRYQYLDFKGMGVSDRIPIQLRILDLYVPLKAWVKAPFWEIINAEAPYVAGQMISIQGIQEPSKSVPILDLVDLNQGLIILGDPGAGKTTFLKVLSLRLAQEGLSFISDKELFAPTGRLPILIPIAAYANTLRGRSGGYLRLDDFIIKHIFDRGGQQSFETLFRYSLKHGKVLFMMDGLDEISDVNTKTAVMNNFSDYYSYSIQEGNKFILTSRIIGYREVRPIVSKLAECTVTDFSDEEIENFIEKWTIAIEKRASGDSFLSMEEAKKEHEELLAAINQSPGVRKLAANPLMLTILALMKRQGLTLPQRRAELYWKYIEIFLLKWNRVRSLGQGTKFEMDVLQTIKILSPLSRRMYERGEARALLSKSELISELNAIFTERGEQDPSDIANKFLKDINEYAGLIIERGNDQYGFIHLTFQEFLAAIDLAQQGQESVEPVVNILLDHISDSSWREISLLTIGYLGIVQHRDLAASAVIDGLLRKGTPANLGLRVLLAGDAVIDASLVGVSKTCKQNTIQALIQVMSNYNEVSPSIREKAGRVLAKLGDPRENVMTLDGMEFLYIPPGKYITGNNTDITKTKDIDYGFWISRYPITNKQYSSFVQDGGYDRPEFWVEVDRAGFLIKGKFYSLWDNKHPRDKPYAFEEPLCLDNHPIVGITWYEATAFCRWFNKKYTHHMPKGFFPILPSIWEWEKVVRGGQQIPKSPIIQILRDTLREPGSIELLDNPNPSRCFPWGQENDMNKANTLEGELGTTSAVGCFPNGASPYGCEEMCGNTWEWTRNFMLSNTEIGESLTFPPSSNMLLRGESWHYPESGKLLWPNYFTTPIYWSDDIGFRIVITKFPYE